MKSRRAKALQDVGGAPLIWHVMNAVSQLAPQRRIVIAAPDHDPLREALGTFGIDAEIAVQEHATGTADAASVAVPRLTGDSDLTLIHYVDTPLVSPGALQALRQSVIDGAAVAVLGFEAAQPAGYGRLERGADGSLERIVEAADAGMDERALRSCNSGVVCAPTALLAQLLAQVGHDNVAGERYLTDIVSIARKRGLRCEIVDCSEAEALGMNVPADLIRLEAIFQDRARQAAIDGGAILTAPTTVHLSYDTVLAAGCRIEPYVVFGPGVTVDEEVVIRSFSHLVDCRIAAGAEIGPFARLRPGAEIGSGVRVGNFVEVKKSVIGEGAKIPHLTYIGDAVIGKQANIGAGSVTCNYDGIAKHRTAIGARAAIGSGTLFVAPVDLGDDAMTAAGSVITDAVPGDALAIARQRQINKPAAGAATRRRARRKAEQD